MLLRTIAVACIVFPGCLAAQAGPPSYTQMILGAGFAPGLPAVNVGFEHRPTGSKIAWRAMLEYRDRIHDVVSSPDHSSYSRRTTYALQLLGVRQYRADRRVQPYVFGGLGIFHQAVSGSQAFIDRQTGFVDIQRSNETLVYPSLLWGVGTSVRVSGVTLFGELRLPEYSPSSRQFRGGWQSPFFLGIRF
jgi:hypothetical protein